MNKIQLYIYPNARMPIHDSDPDYRNTVPFCIDGILEHCEIVAKDDAELFYMGQFSDECPSEIINSDNFQYWIDCPDKHVCDIEGDWPFRDPPSWLWASPITINGCSRKYDELNWFVRPTFSKLLLDLAKNRKQEKFPLVNKRFGFLGLPDQHGCRQKMKQIIELLKYPANIEFTNTWHGPTKSDTDISHKFQKHMLDNIFALCPRGNGKDSARFFEACFFGRIPIIIGDNKIPFENQSPPFFFRIKETDTIELWETILDKIYSLSMSEILELSEQASFYFHNKIKTYIQDPTKTYIEWLYNENSSNL